MSAGSNEGGLLYLAGGDVHEKAKFRETQDERQYLDIPRNEEQNKSRWEKASWPSKLTFAWTSKIILSASHRPLTKTALGAIPKSFLSEMTNRDFRNFWKRRIEDNRSWNETIVHFQSRKVFLSFLPLFFSELSALCIPLVGRKLAFLLKGAGSKSWELVGVAGIIFGLGLLNSLLENHGNFLVSQISQTMRTAVMTQITRKSLRLSRTSRQKVLGKGSLNLMAMDSNRIYNHLLYLHQYWIIPFRSLMTCFLCCYFLGWASVSGLSFLAFVVPFLLWAGQRTKVYRIGNMVTAADRIQMMEEYLSGLKIIKYFSLENVILNKISQLRAVELDYCKKTKATVGFAVAVMYWAPVFAATLSIGTYAIIHKSLEADVVTAALLVFQLFSAPFLNLYWLLSTLMGYLGACDRIDAFMTLPEARPVCNLNRDSNVSSESSKAPSDCILEINRADFAWDNRIQQVSARPRRKTIAFPKGTFGTEQDREPDKEFKLRDICLSVKRGSLVAIVGPIGAGKTSLMDAIMGDLNIERGSLNVNAASIGYCEQNPWIMDASVKENIIFGRPFDPALYTNTIRQCCLEEDLERLPLGDDTFIGEKGTPLSGGQKQRIAIARMVYSQPDLVLFDDPFSALHAPMVRHIFYAIKYGILSDKTRIIATHDKIILDEVDLIVVMDGGEIKFIGSFEEIKNSQDPRLSGIRSGLCNSSITEDDDFSVLEDGSVVGDPYRTRLISTFKDHISMMIPEATESESGDTEEILESVNLPHSSRVAGELEFDNKDSEVDLEARRWIHASGNAALQKRHRESAQKLQEKLSKRISRESLKAYIKEFGGNKTIVLIVFFVLLAEVSRVAKDQLMRFQLSGSDSYHLAFGLFLAYYSSMGLLQGVFSAAANISVVIFCARASKHLHEICIKRVFSLRPSSLQSTNLGRILVRFSRDLDIIDSSFAERLSFLLVTSSAIVSSFLMILWMLPTFAVTLMVPSLIYWRIYKNFSRAFRQVTQLSSQSMAPILTHFGEILTGLTTIRACSAERFFIQAFYDSCDQYSNTILWMNAIRRWMCIRSDLVGNSYIFSIICLCIWLRVPSIVIGIALSYLNSASSCMSLSIKLLADVELSLVSIERLYKFSMGLPIEESGNEVVIPAPAQRSNSIFRRPSAAPNTTITLMPPPQWPTEGRIEFSNVSFNYGQGLPHALKNVNLTVLPKEKIVILGHSGAGKSSIISCLYRFGDLSKGKIFIDGVDISKISLERLRRALAIVPQDPLLFSGTLRSNLDPENKVTDDQMWHALECCYMKGTVLASPERLDMDVGEGGSAFSLGQRQLICLARAMLRFSPIVVLDEATSSIDLETESLIQSSILHSFRECTLLTIAHRLDSVMSYDRVAVMSNGQITELGSPTILAQTPGSQFRRMLIDAGVDLNSE